MTATPWSLWTGGTNDLSVFHAVITPSSVLTLRRPKRLLLTITDPSFRHKSPVVATDSFPWRHSHQSLPRSGYFLLTGVCSQHLHFRFFHRSLSVTHLLFYSRIFKLIKLTYFSIQHASTVPPDFSFLSSVLAIFENYSSARAVDYAVSQCWVLCDMNVICYNYMLLVQVIFYNYLLLWSKCNMLLLHLLVKSNKITISYFHPGLENWF